MRWGSADPAGGKHIRPVRIRVAAIVLAAGRGGRVGTPKYRLEIAGEAFWRLIVQRLNQAGIQDIAIVVRRHHRHEIGDPRIETAVNYRPQYGMFSSLQAGLRRLPGFDGYLVCPVDHPLVSVETYRRLYRAFAGSPRYICRPVFSGRVGHPIIIPRIAGGYFLRCPPPSRLDRLIAEGGWICHDVAVKDKHILTNINTSSDLENAERDL